MGLVVRRRRFRRGMEMGELQWERCRLRRGLVVRLRPYALLLKKRRLDDAKAVGHERYHASRGVLLSWVKLLAAREASVQRLEAAAIVVRPVDRLQIGVAEVAFGRALDLVVPPHLV